MQDEEVDHELFAQTMMPKIYEVLDGLSDRISMRSLVAPIEILQVLTKSESLYPIDMGRVIFKLIIVISNWNSEVY